MAQVQGARHNTKCMPEQNELQLRMHVNFIKYDSESKPINKKFKIPNIKETFNKKQ